VTLFKNKYRVETARLKNWDYGSSALYFITICCANREHFFGEIRDGQMILNGIGEIVQHEWLKTPGIRPDMNLTLEEFIVMPNHFHAIINIGKNRYNSFGGIHGINGNHDIRGVDGRDAMHRVSTINTDTNTSINAGNIFGPQSKNIVYIVRGFKSAVSKQVRTDVSYFGWQRRYHDHIIRDKEAHLHIQQYIVNNPQNWQEDRFYTV